jgi:hypothetical protein
MNISLPDSLDKKSQHILTILYYVDMVTIFKLVLGLWIVESLSILKEIFWEKFCRII